MNIMSFGYGEAVAVWHRHCVQLGLPCQIAASVRNPDKAETLRALGVQPHLWQNSLDTEGVQALQNAEIVVISAAPKPEGDTLFPHLLPILQDSTNLRWLGYLSSTNVYGNHDGGWVNEDTPTNPTGARGRGRVIAEQQWLQSGLPAHVFRLAGIYGHGRNQIRKLQSGRARQLIKAGHVFNRIHETDIAQVLNASITQPNAGRIYNLADDCPAPPQEVLQYAAKLCGADLPPPEDHATAELKGLAKEFYFDNKRILNARIKTELGVQLRFPDYRAGLQDFWDSSSGETGGV